MYIILSCPFLCTYLVLSLSCFPLIMTVMEALIYTVHIGTELIYLRISFNFALPSFCKYYFVPKKEIFFLRGKKERNLCS